MRAVPLVYAVVLHWRTPALTARCLEALAGSVGQGGGFELRLLVVDNGSGDAPSAASLPHVAFECVLLPENTGYAGGNNVGLRYAFEAGAAYVFLVNSDVVVAPDCLLELLREAAQQPLAGMLGPLVLRESAPDRVESNGQQFGRLSGRHIELDRGRLASEMAPAPRTVDAVSGCALLASRRMVERVGLLDERLFLYFEDVDWCLRARDAGFAIIAVPRARVWHRGGASIGPAAPRTTLYSVRNHLLVMARRGRLRPGQLSWPLVVGYHLGYLLLNPRHRSRAHFSALARGAWHAWRGRAGAET